MRHGDPGVVIEMLFVLWEYFREVEVQENERQDLLLSQATVDCRPGRSTPDHLYCPGNGRGCAAARLLLTPLVQCSWKALTCTVDLYRRHLCFVSLVLFRRYMPATSVC